jgi:NitT/TauT family transport system ATP-binding protein
MRYWTLRLSGLKVDAAMAIVIDLDLVALGHPKAPAPLMGELSLAVEAGAFVSVVGGSGVGKSTLLRAAAGLLLPEAGRVITHMPGAKDRRDRAFVFQDSRLMPWRIVSANVALGHKRLKIPPEDADARVREGWR